MGKTKLNFRFHNPNTDEATANYIIKIFLGANQIKLDRALREMAQAPENLCEQKESDSA